MKTDYVPPPYINRTLARHVRIGDPFSLTCSVTIDFGTMVELNWKTPNSKAISDNRVTTPHIVTKNLTMSGTHLKVVEQVNHFYHMLVFITKTMVYSHIHINDCIFISSLGNHCSQGD